MLAVLYGTGPRRSELVNLDLADYATSMDTITVCARTGNKDRHLLPNALCTQALREWLTVQGQDPGSNGANGPELAPDRTERLDASEDKQPGAD